MAMAQIDGKDNTADPERLVWDELVAEYRNDRSPYAIAWLFIVVIPSSLCCIIGLIWGYLLKGGIR